jgi:GNAT superfamily N-acetyltransferase
MTTDTDISIKPLTMATWPDFERLFGASGASCGCWCTWWRLSAADFSKFDSETKKNYLRTLVQEGKIPGLIAYMDGAPVGWVAVAPREEFPRLERSRPLARVDDKPVWSINCFFVDRHHRKQGLMTKLIEAAIQFAGEHGATIVEAYPVDVAGKADSGSLYHGVTEIFRRLGFIEVARRSPNHPVMRRTL